MTEKKDKTILVIIGLSLLAIGAFFVFRKKPEQPESEQEVLKDAYDNLVFETGKDTIKPFSYPHLDELATVLNKSPKWKLAVSGHTDNTGSEEFNKKLSLARAESVKKYLNSKGIIPERITTAGFGSTMPISDNKTPEGRALNRRVEFVITKEQGETVTV